MDLFDAATPPERKKRKIGEHGESPEAYSMAVKNDGKGKSIQQHLKKWGLAKEFTVCDGSRLGCITCMKYGAWCEQERADTKGKKKKKKV